jgi:2-octaprenylphenol hydroxylase
MALEYDLIIIGGGIVGATLANSLANSTLKIALIDQQGLELAPFSAELDLRVSAITSSSEQTFKHIQAWDEMQSMRVSSYTQMFVWDAGSQAKVHFNANTMGKSNLGYIIENSVMQRALLAKINAHHNIDVLTKSQLQKISVNSLRVQVQLQSGQTLSAKLLIGADGLNSQVRELAGIGLTKKSYGHSAIVATVHCELPHHQTAWQCFLPDGILAFLPLQDPHTCSIVWSANTQVAERLMKLDAIGFAQALTDVYSTKLGVCSLLSEKMAYPLAMRHVNYYVTPRVALVGDAAHTIHPLAGQGLNLGLADAAELAYVIQKTHAQHRDIGLMANLRPYERRRKAENTKMMLAMQGFKSIFGTELSPFVWLRGKGLALVDKTAWLKYFFVQQARGPKFNSKEESNV